MKKIQIYDNFLDKNIENNLYDCHCFGGINYYYKINFPDKDNKDKNVIKGFSFFHVSYRKEYNPPNNSTLSDIFINPIDLWGKKHNKNINNLKSIISNFYTPQNNFDNSKYIQPRIDDNLGNGSHTMIYYCNDNDGETKLFNKEKTKIIETITSKKGRAVIFETNEVPYAECYPKNTDRKITIVTNFKVK
jgi:hypothetical protein